ncbi:hypothetical protein EDC04DRAFT_2730015, partial [Pisolithus marmoratus]
MQNNAHRSMRCSDRAVLWALAILSMAKDAYLCGQQLSCEGCRQSTYVKKWSHHATWYTGSGINDTARASGSTI